MELVDDPQLQKEIKQEKKKKFDKKNPKEKIDALKLKLKNSKFYGYTNIKKY
jgi:hypothetical protein